MNVKKFIEGLIAAGQEFIERTAQPGLKEPTRQKKYRSPRRQNHSKGESKARRKMAAKSNRINRQRVKNWKH